ncbi:MAG: T9SS type A sorting domain-containing protein [Melioribacteraceae bacterium]|nr:T9SS type A sorting domain-containing protein [Melioribacteraceae bacterium]
MRIITLFYLMFCFNFLSIYSQSIVSLSTDKARYSNGETVNIKIELEEIGNTHSIIIEVYHLAQLLDQINYTSITTDEIIFEWLPPEDDFKGYLVSVKLLEQSLLLENKFIAVDVSSDWSKFPRYGFLSDYSELSDEQIQMTVEKLNRYHINGIQFYDWHWKHHVPLKGTPENPAEYWLDIANRTNYLSTINRYIEAAHSKNMTTLAYNLLYGAMEDAWQDGVQEDWYLFKDQFHFEKDEIDLSFWGHYLYVMNTSSSGWNDYIYSKMNDVFDAINFDGWHIDQLGDRGTRYDYTGSIVQIDQSFSSYLIEASETLNKKLVMNAVNQYGYKQIADSPVDFLYSEVWYPNDTYFELANIIGQNFNYSSGTKNTVLAAYINHDLSGNQGYFNTPSVLLVDAVIFAFGGAHIELGEHMLGHEYFPNNNLAMSQELEEKIVDYYDFLTAYQNLLRDERTFFVPSITSGFIYEIKPWPPSIGKISTIGVKTENEEIIHLINFAGTSTLYWQDNEGTQTEPILFENIEINIDVEKIPESIWIASPDFKNLTPQELQFEKDADKITVTIPKLYYWSMLVLDYNAPTYISNEINDLPNKFELFQNYPNPFNPTTVISYQLSVNSKVSLKVYDILGREVAVLVNDYQSAGNYQVEFNAEGLSSGVYYCRIESGSYSQTKKMNLLK